MVSLLDYRMVRTGLEGLRKAICELGEGRKEEGEDSGARRFTDDSDYLLSFCWNVSWVLVRLVEAESGRIRILGGSSLWI